MKERDLDLTNSNIDSDDSATSTIYESKVDMKLAKIKSIQKKQLVAKNQ